MAEIRPFKGVHYSASLIKDLSTVICPPHDIISPQQQEELYRVSEYNFVRLEYGRELPQDTVTDNKYSRAAVTLDRWLKEGILEADPLPVIYLHDHTFALEGKQYKRRSIIARVRLEEWDKMVIRPHEATMAVTRSDRLSLLWALQANTSPILVMFEDKQVSSSLADLSRNTPLIGTKQVNGESHSVWAIADTDVIGKISRSLAGRPLYVADGHHRYESALAYRNERRSSSTPAHAPFNFVMMELVDFADPGLKILAPHRLVRGISRETLEGLTAKLEAFFEIEKVSLNATDVRRQVDELLKGTEGVKLALFGPSTLLRAGPEKDYFSVLRLKDLAAASRLMPGDRSEIYKKLDVSIVDHIILKNLLGMDSATEKTGLAYSHDLLDAVNRVRNGEYQLAMLIRPVKPGTLKAVSDAGDKMPPKSTYFYPKAPAGLIFNRLVD